MKRRGRKKLRLGEFQEFYMRVEMRVDKSQVSDDDFVDRWIEAIEADQMVCGGGDGPDESWDFAISCRADLESSRQKRARIERWLAAETGVREFWVSPVYADLTRAFERSPRAAMRQWETNRQRGVGSEIWRDGWVKL